MRKVRKVTSDEARKNHLYSVMGDVEHLLRIIRLLVRPYQSEVMRRIFLHDGGALGGERVEPTFKNLWFDAGDAVTRDGHRLTELTYDRSCTPLTIDIAKDPILPWPWNQGRLDDALAFMGAERGYGEWEYDNLNHSVALVLPVRIGIVWGGNHSLSAGLVTGGGTIETENIIDLSALYPHVVCDGRFYRHAHSGEAIAKVQNEIFAAVFEIGRIISELEEARAS